jgi:hypothetical protein
VASTYATGPQTVEKGFRDALADGSDGVAAQLSTLAGLGEPTVTAPLEYVRRSRNDDATAEPSCTVYLEDNDPIDYFTAHRTEVMTFVSEVVCASTDEEEGRIAAQVYSRALSMVVSKFLHTEQVSGVGLVDLLDENVRPAEGGDLNRWVGYIAFDCHVRTLRNQ